ncbi:MAG: hypothetical protein RIA10_07990, partial [Amphiplicatus sp.]
GVGGAAVYVGDEHAADVPTYAAESYFRIGAGDVFAAAFAFAWGEQKMSAVAAADYAARCSAFFVNGPRLPLPSVDSLLPQQRMCAPKNKKVVVLGFGSLELETLLLHTAAWLTEYGCEPVVEVFKGEIAIPPDAPVLYVIGSEVPETEIRQRLVPAPTPRRSVVYWSEAESARAAAMFPGSYVTDDYSTALYHTLRMPEK